jgi:hypothetical protein
MVSRSAQYVSLPIYLVDNLQQAQHQVAHVLAGLALGGDVVGLAHQLLEHLLPGGGGGSCGGLGGLGGRE